MDKSRCPRTSRLIMSRRAFYHISSFKPQALRRSQDGTLKTLCTSKPSVLAYCRRYENTPRTHTLIWPSILPLTVFMVEIWNTWAKNYPWKAGRHVLVHNLGHSSDQKRKIGWRSDIHISIRTFAYIKITWNEWQRIAGKHHWIAECLHIWDE